ncbi:hypothetical protein [Kitasatospora sp. NPDC088548]|uniref:hypothetical protein n=1 Tax=Kitasatospora sp. NPDC088548 TaxID=3364075 RepID=UPI0037FEA6A8
MPLVRVLALPGLLGMPADIALSFSLDLPDLWLPVLNALLLLIAPPGGRTHPRSAVPWALTVAIITGDIAITLTGGFATFPLVTPVVTGAAVACTARTTGRAALASVLLAAPPFLTSLLIGSGIPTPYLQLLTVQFAFGYVIALGAVRLTGRLARWRSGLLSRRSDLSGP